MPKFKLVTLFCALLFFTYCRSENEHKTKFQSDITEYLNAYNKTDWEKVTSMIYPHFFFTVSKSRVIFTLKKLDSDGMKRTFTLKGLYKISDVITEGKEKYCRIYYAAHINAVINKEQFDNIETFRKDFEEDYGKENVVYDDKLHKFSIEANQSVIAVADADSDNWKYMELNNEHAMDLVSEVVPQKVFKELTSFKQSGN
jgi:hypothetical protein